ncbi:MAG: hypothetical protein LIR46_14535 [Bacteroidota bacterium]|nr:hypothetical protein [Bacteroidota bacterium]
MKQKQFRGLVDCLANVCVFNTSNAYSLSLHEYQDEKFYHANLLVFTMNPNGVFNSSDIELLLSLGRAWNVSLYFETINGVTVAKYI